MKSLILTLIMIIGFTKGFAYDVCIDGINYSLNTTNKRSEVTYKSNNDYSGTITIPDSIVVDSITYCVTSIGSNAFACSENLVSVKIPNSIISVGDSAFANCNNLETVYIGEGVEKMGDYCFYGTRLSSITLPASIKYIGHNFIFSYGTSFGGFFTIVCKAFNPPTAYDDSFLTSSSLSNLIVPDSTRTQYDNAIGWRNYYWICEESGMNDDKINIDLRILDFKENDLANTFISIYAAGLTTLKNKTLYLLYSIDNKNLDISTGTRISLDDSWPQYGCYYGCGIDVGLMTKLFCRLAVITFDGDVFYSDIYEFTTHDTTTDDFVDMGKGYSIARCDIGASSPEASGNRYAWGEIETKESYTKENYTLYNSTVDYYFPIYSIDGTKYDIVTSIYGEGYTIPNASLIEGMTNNRNQIYCTKTTYNGVSGIVLRSDINGNTVFIPCTNHWTSTTKYDDNTRAYYFDKDFQQYRATSLEKFNGCFIRAVKYNDSSTDIITAYDENNVNFPTSKKFIRNGRIVILKNGIQYNVNGCRIKG